MRSHRCWDLGGACAVPVSPSFGNQLTGGGVEWSGGQGRPQFPFPVSQCGADHGAEQRCSVGPVRPGSVTATR